MLTEGHKQTDVSEQLCAKKEEASFRAIKVGLSCDCIRELTSASGVRRLATEKRSNSASLSHSNEFMHVYNITEKNRNTSYDVLRTTVLRRYRYRTARYLVPYHFHHFFFFSSTGTSTGTYDRYVPYGTYESSKVPVLPMNDLFDLKELGAFSSSVCYE